VLDAFIYAFFSINLVTLGMYMISQMWFFEGGIIPTLVVSCLIILSEVVVYAGLIAVMPRAGGDYVWQSRILGSGIGFVLAVTGWWFILWLWTPLYSDMLRHIFFVPILAVAGAKDAALWFASSPFAWFLVTVFMLIYVGIVIASGMKAYAKVQKFCFWTGNIGLLFVFAFLLFGTSDAFRSGLEANASKLFAAQPGVYDATIAIGKEAGATTPLNGGSIAAIFLAMPYIVFFNLWPNWGATLYGEVKGSTDFKKNFWGMAAALIVTTALASCSTSSWLRPWAGSSTTARHAAYWSYRWDATGEWRPLPFPCGPTRPSSPSSSRRTLSSRSSSSWL
jgi:amino acid transporter